MDWSKGILFEHETLVKSQSNRMPSCRHRNTVHHLHYSYLSFNGCQLSVYVCVLCQPILPSDNSRDSLIIFPEPHSIFSKKWSANTKRDYIPVIGIVFMSACFGLARSKMMLWHSCDRQITLRPQDEYSNIINNNNDETTLVSLALAFAVELGSWKGRYKNGFTTRDWGCTRTRASSIHDWGGPYGRETVWGWHSFRAGPTRGCFLDGRWRRRVGEKRQEGIQSTKKIENEKGLGHNPRRSTGGFESHVSRLFVAKLLSWKMARTLQRKEYCPRNLQRCQWSHHVHSRKGFSRSKPGAAIFEIGFGIDVHSFGWWWRTTTK